MIHSIRHSGKRLLLKMGFYRFPDFLIIGAQKAGTTFLYSVLRQHPDILEPVEKEAHFFDYNLNYSAGLFKYKLNFDLSFRFRKSQKTFEATPDYLACYDAPKRISRHFPDIKLIVVLREPVSRAYSAWKMHHFLFENHHRHKWLYDSRSFEEVIQDGLKDGADPWNLFNHIGRGLYGMQLENFLKYFPKKNLLVLFHEDLKGNTQEEISKVCDFVGIKDFFIHSLNRNDERFWENKSLSNQELELSPTLSDKLREYYLPDKTLLENIIGRKFSW